MLSFQSIPVALLVGGEYDELSLHPREANLLRPRAVAKRRDDFVRGRRVGRELSCQVLGIDPQCVAILPDERGVPQLEHDDFGRLPYSLSLSHTTGVCGAAMTSLPWCVGIDVECPLESPGMVVDEYFAGAEVKHCVREGAEEMGWRAAEIWSLKEAGLKALGIGLTVPVASVRVGAVHDRSGANGWRDAMLRVAPSLGTRGCDMVAWVRREHGVVVALAVVACQVDVARPEPEALRLV